MSCGHGPEPTSAGDCPVCTYILRAAYYGWYRHSGPCIRSADGKAWCRVSRRNATLGPFVGVAGVQVGLGPMVTLCGRAREGQPLKNRNTTCPDCLAQYQQALDVIRFGWRPAELERSR